MIESIQRPIVLGNDTDESKMKRFSARTSSTDTSWRRAAMAVDLAALYREALARREAVADVGGGGCDDGDDEDDLYR